MFEDGKEVLRFPLAKEDEKPASGFFGTDTTPQYYEKELVKYFDLDKRYLATNSVAAGEKKKAATWVN